MGVRKGCQSDAARTCGRLLCPPLTTGGEGGLGPAAGMDLGSKQEEPLAQGSGSSSSSSDSTENLLRIVTSQRDRFAKKLAALEEEKGAWSWACAGVRPSSRRPGPV